MAIGVSAGDEMSVNAIKERVFGADEEGIRGRGVTVILSVGKEF